MNVRVLRDYGEVAFTTGKVCSCCLGLLGTVTGQAGWPGAPCAATGSNTCARAGYAVVAFVSWLCVRHRSHFQPPHLAPIPSLQHTRARPHTAAGAAGAGEEVLAAGGRGTPAGDGWRAGICGGGRYAVTGPRRHLSDRGSAFPDERCVRNLNPWRALWNRM